MASPRSADDVAAAALGLFESLQFQDALDLIEREGDAHAGAEPLLPFMKACAQARLDDHEAAVATLAESGHWYSAGLIERSRSLDAVRASGALDRLIETFERRRRADLRGVESLLVSEDTPGSSSLLLALHGNWDSHERAFAAWRPAVPDDWSVAALASAEAIAPGRYAWYGGAALDEITAALQDLRSSYGFEGDRIVLAGISSGAATAVDALLAGLEVRGVIAAAVGPPSPENAAGGHGRRIYFIIGSEEAVELRQALAQRAAELADAGVRSIIETVPGLGHAYPDDLPDVAQRALAFVMPSSVRQ